MHVCKYCATTLNHRAFGVSKAGSNCNTLEDLQLEPGKGLPTSNCILIFLILQLFESTFLSFPALNGTRSHSRPGFNLLATSESVWYVKRSCHFLPLFFSLSSFNNFNDGGDGSDQVFEKTTLI